MKYDPEKHHRRSIRLKDYDYSQSGAYFITICTHNRECLFGEIMDGEIRLNKHGEIVLLCWNDLHNHYVNIGLDAFVIMPNHVHGIVLINDINDVGAIHELPLQQDRIHRRRMLIPKIIGRFKMKSAKRINETHASPGTPLWQRNYYEHIIRNENDLLDIREYIANNPIRWAEDENNPTNINEGRPTGSPLDILKRKS